MASLPTLISRMNSLIAAHRQTVALIQQLSNPSTTDDPYDTDAPSDLASDIQQSLKEQEDELEILRLDAEDLLQPTSNSPAGARWVGGGSTIRRRENERDSERERIAAQVHKLSEDLKSARRSFRRAQLSAKRHADAQRARERAELFAPPPVPSQPDQEGSAPSSPRPRSRQTSRTRATERKHLTQDDLTLAASSDVTNALKRTHHLLSSSVQQSQFAAETLASSSTALASLSESYSSLDTMLASSRSLVGSLIRSNKSDTWYLTTAFYMCAATLGWLIFRRWLYGPMWWLLWLPLKWSWWTAAALFGLATSQSQPSSASSLSMTKVLPTTSSISGVGKEGIPRNNPSVSVPGRGAPYMNVGGKGGGWRRSPVKPQTQSQPSPSSATATESSTTSMVDKIGEMAEKIRDQFPIEGSDDVEDHGEEEGEEGLGAEEGKEQGIHGGDEVEGDETMLMKEGEENVQRNPKKRMWEEPIRQEPIRQRDEL